MSYSFTISINPFKTLMVCAFLFVCFVVVGYPSPVANQTVTPPSEEQLQVATQVELVRSELQRRVTGISPDDLSNTARVLVNESRAAGFDPLWVLAVIETESGFDVEACSPSKAKGLMQLLPSTFAMVSKGKIFNPIDNVKAGIAYLSILGKSFKRPETILMAYNGGPRNASNFLKAKQANEDLSGFKDEMKEYPGRVMGKYAKLLARNGKDPKQARKLFKIQPAPVMLAST